MRWEGKNWNVQILYLGNWLWYIDRTLEGEPVCGKVINLVWDMLFWTCLQDMQMEVSTGSCVWSLWEFTSSQAWRIFIPAFPSQEAWQKNGLRTKSYMRGILSSMLQDLFVSTPTPACESREVKREMNTPLNLLWQMEPPPLETILPTAMLPYLTPLPIFLWFTSDFVSPNSWGLISSCAQTLTVSNHLQKLYIQTKNTQLTIFLQYVIITAILRVMHSWVPTRCQK